METIIILLIVIGLFNIILLYLIAIFMSDIKDLKERLDASERNYFKLYEKITQVDNSLFDHKMDVKMKERLKS